jgi:nucleoside-diphosphate-sugar epimerase
MHLMILGGTGSAGRALIELLAALRPAVDVSVVSRSATDLPGARHVLTGHFSDLARSTDFRRRLMNVDAIVHLADGLSILQQSQHAFDAAQAGRLVESSERLAQAAEHARVPLFIYLSSIKALTDEEDDRVLVETSEAWCSTLYGRCKLRLEDRIASIFRGSATRSVILRAPVLYGPRAKGSMRRLLTHIDTAWPLPLGGLADRRSLLCERNLASAIDTVLHSDRGGASGVFHIHDGPPLTATEIVATLRHALGRPARLFPIPSWVARAARHVPLMRPIVRRLTGSLELCDAQFRRSFRWRPVADTRTALAEMASAFAAEKGRAAPPRIQREARQHARQPRPAVRSRY